MEKTAKAKYKNADFKSLRFKLTLGFVAFALVLMGLLWVMQTAAFDKFYEKAMAKRAETAVRIVSAAYSNSEKLTVEEFYDQISSLSREGDLYFFIEDTDLQHSVTSMDFSKSGRIYSQATNLIAVARENLQNSNGGIVSISMNGEDDAVLIVEAARVDSKYRSSINLYAVSTITPLGPTVEILRSLLFFVTIIALAIGGFIAFVIAKTFSRPIAEMNNSAKELGKGNYNVRFDAKRGFTEIEELAETLNSTAEELGRADALQKDLIANVSHDLRTPLTMVKSYAEMIRDISGDDKAKREEHLGVIIEEADRLSDLVGDILTISKMQSGTMEMEQKPFDLQEAAETIYSTYIVLEQEGFKFNFEKLDGGVTVVGDEAKIQQVISNLLSNAVHYSKEDNPEITLRFEKTDDTHVRCSVIDNGVGIAEQDIADIWNRYQRASKQSGRNAGGGTGLGLAIVREILERHNATCGVNSTLGSGSTFYFEMTCKYS